MQELINLLLKHRVTPNQLALLHCIQESIRPESLLPSMMGEVMICQRQGFLNTENQLQPKAQLLLSEADKLFKASRKKKVSFDTEEFLVKLNEFKNMFPPGNLPTGKPGRTNINELKKKMATFFTDNPQYDWDLVLDATEAYVEHFRKQGFAFMKTAGYFISKNNESELANYCDMLMDGGDVRAIKKSIYNVS